MDQMKIGKFIAENRKKQQLTQMQLAQKLGITDRAVSKWETGRSMPDASIMLELCGLLKITVNDLLSGEVISMNGYNEQSEKNLIAMVKEKEQADKRMLMLEIVIGVVSTVLFFAMIAIGAVIKEKQMKEWIFWLLFGGGFAQFIVCMLIALRIEQTAGFYECRKCGHRYVPSYKSVNLAMHMGRTRYMKCPRCGKRSWQKKVLKKEEKSE